MSSPNLSLAVTVRTAWAMLGGRQWSEAERAAVTALRLDPTQVEALTYLGTALVEQDRPTEAAPRLAYATVLDPEAPLAWHSLGRARQALGDRQDAIDAANNVIALCPGNRSGYALKGAVLGLNPNALAMANPGFTTLLSAGFTTLSNERLGTGVDPELLSRGAEAARAGGKQILCPSRRIIGCGAGALQGDRQWIVGVSAGAGQPGMLLETVLNEWTIRLSPAEDSITLAIDILNQGAPAGSRADLHRSLRAWGALTDRLCSLVKGPQGEYALADWLRGDRRHFGVNDRPWDEGMVHPSLLTELRTRARIPGALRTVAFADQGSLRAGYIFDEHPDRPLRTLAVVERNPGEFGGGPLTVEPALCVQLPLAEVRETVLAAGRYVHGRPIDAVIAALSRWAALDRTLAALSEFDAGRWLQKAGAPIPKIRLIFDHLQAAGSGKTII